MAPGVGGNGCGGSRQTGTVPKTKSHNETSREYNGIPRREYQHLNHTPNNLSSSMEWQPVNDSHSRSRTRKESNTRYSESYDPGEENTVTQDNLWFSSGQRSQVYHSDDDEVSQASWAENGYKSNNLGLPDKSQVASRLHQIRDYVTQTMSMMDTLSSIGGQEDAENLQAAQMVEPRRERPNKPISGKSPDTARRTELKKQVQVSQLKLQELQEQQAALKALRQKAQEQLNEARAAQGALLTAHGINQQGGRGDNVIQDRLHNLQRFLDTRHQIVQMAGLEDDVDSPEMQNKLDELQAKKHHMDQMLAQFSNLTSHNVADEMTVEECERDVENKMAELNTMRETLAMLQSNLSTQLQPGPSQERVAKIDLRPSVEKCNTTSSQAFQSKSQQLQEAKSKLQQLSTLLQTVEELRENGQPIPESILQLMASPEQCSSPTQQDRSDLSSQDLNVSQPASERMMNSCERPEPFTERSIHNSSERERGANATKHTNQEGKLGTKVQLEELLRNQDLNMPQPLQSSSFQENSTTTGTWGGSTQDTLDDGYNTEYQGEMHESASSKNVMTSSQPHNLWRKPSSGSGVSRSSWSPYEARRVHSDNTVRPTPQPPSYPPPQDIPQQPDNHWIVHQISQLQSQLQQMSGLYKNFVEKQHNCPPPHPPPPPWLAPANVQGALGPYCQYVASASQWQQQQLLVHSLNQCCQLIWHQQRELIALKEALRLVSTQTLQQAPQEEAHFSPTQPAEAHSNLARPSRPPSRPPKDSLAPPTVVSSAHSLPNLASPQASPSSPAPVNTRNVLSSPTATVLSLPPTLNNTSASPAQHNPNIFFNHNSQFTDPNFINLYPPYGNNLNFEFPSPVNFFPHPPEPFLAWTASSQPQPATTLNNQVPPGNRANNYWDNFRSYSRQNLLSNSVKSNDGLPQRTPLERFLNTDVLPHPREQPPNRCRKERLNAQSRQTRETEAAPRAAVYSEPEGEGGETASGYQPPHPAFWPHPAQGRQQVLMSHSFQHNMCNERDTRRLVNETDTRRSVNDNEVRRIVNEQESRRHVNENEARRLVVENETRRVVNENEARRTINETDSRRILNENEARPLQTARVVNDCETPRGANKKGAYTQDLSLGCECKMTVNKRNYAETREHKMSQLNNYHSENNAEADLGVRPINFENVRNPRNINSNVDCVGDGSFCMMTSADKGVRRKDNRGNISKENKVERKDSLEECVYSEVAALISANEWRPQFLLQLFKDLRLLSSCPDPGMQAALTSIHALANTASGTQQGERLEGVANNQPGPSTATNTPQPRNWSHKDIQPQLPSNCAQLDWEVRCCLVELLPYIKTQLGEVCGPQLLEALRKLILQLVPSQSTQEQLDAQLEDALHKFHGCRLGDVYEEMLTVVADILTSELTFLRLINTVHHSEQQNGDEEVVVEEEEEEEGAVGGVGVVEEPLPPSLLALHPANQPRRTKSETVSEADLAEADQSRHTVSGGEEERGDTAEGIDQLEEEAGGRDVNVASCSGNLETESKTEANWAVEEDRELGLDQVPSRLHDPTSPETEQEGGSNPDPGTM